MNNNDKLFIATNFNSMLVFNTNYLATYFMDLLQQTNSKLVYCNKSIKTINEVIQWNIIH